MKATIRLMFYAVLTFGLAIYTPLLLAGSPFFKTTAEATAAAEKLGYVKTNYFSNGQAVYKANKPIASAMKGLTYITIDVDGHSGGAWKAAKSVAALGSKTTRLGTYNADLTKRVGD